MVDLDGDKLGDVNFGSKTGVFFRSQIQFPFFEYYLKGRNGAPLPKAYVFETGSMCGRSMTRGLRNQQRRRHSIFGQAGS